MQIRGWFDFQTGQAPVTRSATLYG